MDDVFLKLKALLEPFGLTRFYTDHWGAYTRHLDPDVHSPGKRNTQKIERKHLTLRTRINPTTPLSLAFGLPSFPMRERGLVIAPLHPRDPLQSFLYRIRPHGQDDLQ
jgi:IS1 transposase